MKCPIQMEHKTQMLSGIAHFDGLSKSTRISGQDSAGQDSSPRLKNLGKKFRKILNLELVNFVKQTTKSERWSLTEESTYWQTRGREEVFTHSSNFPVAFSSAVLSHLMQARNFGVRVRTQFWHPWRLFHLWRGAATWPERERNKRNTRNGCSGRAATGAGCITSWTRCNGRLSGKDLAFLFDQKSIASMCPR